MKKETQEALKKLPQVESTAMNGIDYEHLMERSALMRRKAEETDDTYLKVFYYNASKGYALKARSIIIGTATADCDVAWHRR